jgi:branched-chain amino acid transport system substrate-binding protein
VRLFEAWFNFGMDKKLKIFGGYWMHQDVLPQMDDRAIGLIGNALHYAAGLDTPENRAFTEAFARKHRRLPSWFAESAYTAGLWTKAAIDAIEGKVENREAFLKAMRTVKVNAPRGPVRMDDHDNPIQRVYISKIAKIKHPVLGDVLTNVPVKTYESVSQFWTWTPEEFLKRGPYKR